MLDGEPSPGALVRGGGPSGADDCPGPAAAALATSPAVKPVAAVVSPRFHGGGTAPRSEAESSG
ncbi:hypothetical protein MUG78_06015 [Gordonia alkaliphila]|uniref:hypothetical protein n=1 Tax=Gordonia alkaliphila TaxID=1053547 RepID=UPI001FF67B18|nr:hypothetical protein [Gordonia alkaliphila]MCK0439032.1 hypothetical protein [Gordonia alkaliphila]